MGMTDAELEAKMRGSDGGVRNFWKMRLETRKMMRAIEEDNARGTKDVYMNTMRGSTSSCPCLPLSG